MHRVRLDRIPTFFLFQDDSSQRLHLEEICSSVLRSPKAIVENSRQVGFSSFYSFGLTFRIAFGAIAECALPSASTADCYSG